MRASAQLSLDLDAPEDWAALETHVVDGVFSPPLTDAEVIAAERGSRRPPRRDPEPALVPEALLRRDGRTYRTTLARLRGHEFCSLLTIRRADGEMEMSLAQVVRAGGDWTSMVFRPLDRSRPERLVILNNDHRPLADPVTVTDLGGLWVAEFEYDDDVRERVHRAGFRWDALDRRWQTRDPRVAAEFCPRLRESLRAQRRVLEAAREPERRPVGLRAPTAPRSGWRGGFRARRR